MDALTKWNAKRLNQLSDEERCNFAPLEAVVETLEAPAPRLGELIQKLKIARAVEQSAVAILITDVRGTIDYINPKFSELTGYAAEELLGRNPRVLKSGQMEPTTYRELWDSVRSGREWRGELHNKKKSGETYWEFASISPVADAAGGVTHFVAFKEDITQRKQVEAAREKLIRELQESLADTKPAGAMLIICSWCNKIRDLKGKWKGLEIFSEIKFTVQFSHGICPGCRNSHFPAIPGGAAHSAPNGASAPQPGAQVIAFDEPARTGTEFQVNEVRSVPVKHWGINE